MDVFSTNRYICFMRYAFILLAISAIFSMNAQPQDNCAAAKHNFYKDLPAKIRATEYPNMLMARYDVHFYFLNLHIERFNTLIDGSTTIGAKLSSPSDTFCFELNQNLQIDSIILNTQAISFARSGNIVYAIPGSPMPAGANIYMNIYYHGDAFVAGGAAIGNGFTHNNSNVWGDTAVFSLSQPYSAYEWFPCKQFLNDKADSAWVFITTSNENMAGSNGVLEGVDTLTATNQLRFRWKTHYMTDYYLISVAVAKYLDYTFYAHPASLPNDSIKIVNYLYRTTPMTFIKIKPVLDSVALMLEYYSDIFGLYPFYKEKYGHCMTPFGGGMEHQTMTSTEYAGHFTLLSHELLHHWFGNYVTCGTWKDIFLNEGFASYGEYLAVDHFRGQDAARSHMTEVHRIAMTDTAGSIYVTDTADVSRVFSWELTYNKGSAVLHTLRFLLGDSLFFHGLKYYLNAFAFSNARISDFKASMENSTNKNLDNYFNQWIYGEGYPVYNAEYYSDSKNLYLKINHHGSASSTPVFITPLEIRCHRISGDTIIKVDITQNSQSFIIPLDEKITNIEIDPYNRLLHKTERISENLDLLLMNTYGIDSGTVVLFPNPSQDEITLYNLLPSETSAEIFDASGNIIQTVYFSKKITIPVHSFASGIYIIRLVKNESTQLKQFLKY